MIIISMDHFWSGTKPPCPRCGGELTAPAPASLGHVRVACLSCDFSDVACLSCDFSDVAIMEQAIPPPDVCHVVKVRVNHPVRWTDETDRDEWRMDFTMEGGEVELITVDGVAVWPRERTLHETP